MKNKTQQKYRIVGKSLMFALILLIGAAATEAKGRKYGLLVGINEYPAPISTLSGCVNDAIKMQAAMITGYGFKKADTSVLTDAQATRQNIINKIKMYEKLAGAGDLFVFHYSGHGTLFPDANSEELDETEMQFVELDFGGGPEVLFPRDKYDSAIVPVDGDMATSGKPWQNLILDDELYAMFSAFTKKGAQVVFISDSCHSGSVARAKISAAVRFMPLHKAFHRKSFADLQLKKSVATKVVTAPPDMNNLYITLTGSKDDEFSLDSSSDGIPMGLFTSTLLKSLNTRAATAKTYKQLMSVVSPQVAKNALKLNNNQNPQLDARFGNPNNLIFSVPKATPTSGKKGK